MSVDSPGLSPQLEAEQAVLGACLLVPSQLASLRAWLEPRHFLRPAHGQFFAVMLAQLDEAALPATGEQRRNWALRAMDTGVRTIPGFSASYGQSLISACPIAAHATAYGRMVLETAVRRSLEQHAHRLLAAAEGGSVRTTVALTASLHTVIDQLTTAWGTIDVRSTKPLPEPDTPTGLLAGRAAENAHDNERMLLASMVASPTRISEITSWLSGGDFLSPSHRAVYQALAALTHRGEPVDELTALWEVQRRGALADGTTTVEEVRTLVATGMPGDAGYWAERVLRASLLRTSATSAGIVRVLALDAAVSAGTLLGDSLRALEPADRLQQRHRAALGAPASDRRGPVVLGVRRQAATRTAGTADRPSRPPIEPSPHRR
ncbi:helicase DnaB [Kitasatospora sp. YST-16]|uniref:DnaB-like helicase N-terminal domain-containing protein n=1 Tax=Kitasatospora sp. YST-16 TaxID=2998080 RepID=UPI002283559F|nr:DnaB-like helicase N-terminal domain-containing protein [Kitasatospora sp. YST-16]WAL74608.1 helicase DnaB [Kitasatospora sp. YST-16]WNW40666.1 DnaB-like helicase N-terminal domain-containing protein [Streptomyces sp. Li-HN-5-13]